MNICGGSVHLLSHTSYISQENILNIRGKGIRAQCMTYTHNLYESLPSSIIICIYIDCFLILIYSLLFVNNKIQHLCDIDNNIPSTCPLSRASMSSVFKPFITSRHSTNKNLIWWLTLYLTMLFLASGHWWKHVHQKTCFCAWHDPYRVTWTLKG